MFVVLEVGVSPLVVDRQPEPFVVLRVTVGVVFTILSFAELLSSELV